MLNSQQFLTALQQALAVNQKTNLYTADINRKQPTAFVFLIDQSGSMSKHIEVDGKHITKAEMASNVLNETLNELLLRATKGDDVREYYQICLIGYGGQSSTEANILWEGKLAGKDWCSVAEINEHFLEQHQYTVVKKTRTGETTQTISRKKWVTPIANLKTPMHEALTKTNKLLEQWLVKYTGIDCYPPTVINITDGNATDATNDQLIAVSKQIKNLHTMDGHVLLFNIHLAGGQHQQIVLPENVSDLPNDIYAQTLYHMSSQLPARYDDELKNLKNATQRKVYTAMCYNADATTLVKIMNIGTTHTSNGGNA